MVVYIYEIDSKIIETDVSSFVDRPLDRAGERMLSVN